MHMAQILVDRTGQRAGRRQAIALDTRATGDLDRQSFVDLLQCAHEQHAVRPRAAQRCHNDVSAAGTDDLGDRGFRHIMIERARSANKGAVSIRGVGVFNPTTVHNCAHLIDPPTRGT
jgi:hypothetical protein